MNLIPTLLVAALSCFYTAPFAQIDAVFLDKLINFSSTREGNSRTLTIAPRLIYQIKFYLRHFPKWVNCTTNIYKRKFYA